MNIEQSIFNRNQGIVQVGKNLIGQLSHMFLVLLTPQQTFQHFVSMYCVHHVLLLTSYRVSEH